jgi:hypothetical protein
MRTFMTPQGPPPSTCHRPTCSRSASSRGAPTLKLGEINARIAPLQVTAEGLVQLGFPVVAQIQGAKLYHADDYLRMLDAMQRLLGKAGATAQAQAAA